MRQSIAILILLAVDALAADRAEFSAAIRHKGVPGEQDFEGKLFAGKSGFRMEGKTDKGTFVWVLNTASKQVMRTDPSGVTTIETSTMTLEEVLEPPCPGYFRRTPAGAETIDGRATEKWVCEDRRLPNATDNFDTRIQAVIRRSLDGKEVHQLSSIKEEPQDPKLFEITPPK